MLYIQLASFRSIFESMKECMDINSDFVQQEQEWWNSLDKHTLGQSTDQEFVSLSEAVQATMHQYFNNRKKHKGIKRRYMDFWGLL